MSVLIFSDNFVTTLAAPITSVATSATLLSTTGLPTIVGDQYFKLSFVDAATGLITEIVNCTALVGSTATIVRGQEGTTAVSWLAGDFVQHNWTAGSAAAMQQLTQAQSQSQNYATDTGSVNAIIATYSPAITSHVTGMPLRVKIANTNTTSTTFNPGPSAKPVTGPDGSALQAGDLLAGGLYQFIYDGANYQFDPVGTNTSRVGTVQLATSAEAIAGTNTTKAVTPSALAATLAAINSVMPGFIMAWPSTTVPTGYLEVNGAGLSTTTYAALFAICGYTFGGSGTTFDLPDSRGLFLRGWSHGTGIDVGRAFGTDQTPDNMAHSHFDGLGAIDTSSQIYGATTTGLPGAATTCYQKENNTPNHQAITSTTGNASEARPWNIAIMYIIKY